MASGGEPAVRPVAGPVPKEIAASVRPGETGTIKGASTMEFLPALMPPPDRSACPSSGSGSAPEMSYQRNDEFTGTPPLCTVILRFGSGTALRAYQNCGSSENGSTFV